MNHIRSTGALALALVLAALATCKDDSRAPQLGDDQGNVPFAGTGGTSGRDPGPDASAGAGGSGASDAGTEGTTVNCGAVACRGAGRCVAGDDGEPTCVCDEGYTLNDNSCVVDETCIELRSIENGCRQRIGGEPAIAMAFNVETCAGTTVLPDVLGDISQAFKVLEDGNDLGEESYATVFDRPVESFVIFAIDMSTSVANDGPLVSGVIDSLRQMIDSLAPGPGDAPVFVRLLPFGRSITLDYDFRSDLATVKNTLDGFAENPTQVVAEPDGTNLNGVVNAALEILEVVIDARVEVTGGAVVATGTLVTITDGRDTGGVTLKPIPPRFNVISVGISGNINDDELTRVGPQGSFLAPDRADRDAAFLTVAQRVKEYPHRTHLLAYCSPAVDGNHAVQATLASREAQRLATCQFNARDFGQGRACNEAFIQGYCEEEGHGCGNFLACDPACWGAPSDAGAVSDAWQFSD